MEGATEGSLNVGPSRSHRGALCVLSRRHRA